MKILCLSAGALFAACLFFVNTTSFAQSQKLPTPEYSMSSSSQPVSNSKQSVVTTPSGLKYIDVVVGKGPEPKKGQTVTVHYTGTFTNGEKFDSSLDRGQPFQFVIGIGQVIKGWDEGVASMKVGGKRQLMIPYQLGYGENGYPGAIPPKAELNFDVELLGIK